MGPTRGRQDPGGPHVGHMNLAVGVDIAQYKYKGRQNASQRKCMWVVKVNHKSTKQQIKIEIKFIIYIHIISVNEIHC